MIIVYELCNVFFFFLFSMLLDNNDGTQFICGHKRLYAIQLISDFHLYRILLLIHVPHTFSKCFFDLKNKKKNKKKYMHEVVVLFFFLFAYITTLFNAFKLINVFVCNIYVIYLVVIDLDIKWLELLKIIDLIILLTIMIYKETWCTILSIFLISTLLIITD